MARGEDQLQEVVTELVVEVLDEVGGGRRGFVTELLVLALEHLTATHVVDRAMLRGLHQPRTGAVRNADARPLLERSDQRILRELLGDTDIARDPREPGDQFR